jgi:hypothetical protein
MLPGREMVVQIQVVGDAAVPDAEHVEGDENRLDDRRPLNRTASRER